MSLTEVKKRAIHLLSIKDYTAFELKQKLSKFGTQDEVEQTLSWLESKKLIDDRLYTQHYYEYQLRQGHGFTWIRNKLLQKGIDIQFIEQFQEAFIDLQLITCVEYAHKLAQMVTGSTSGMKLKIEQKLYSRGYTSSCIYATMQQIDLVEDEDVFEKDFNRTVIKYSAVIEKTKRDQKIIQALMRKGYRYDAIINKLRSE